MSVAFHFAPKLWETVCLIDFLGGESLLEFVYTSVIGVVVCVAT